MDFKDYADIIDISTYQDLSETTEVIDFSKVKAKGIQGVIIKASQGKATDQDFYVNRTNAKAAGLPRGFYHFLIFTISGKEQAQYFWNLVKDDPGELFLAVDFEGIKNVATPSNAKQYLRDFVVELERLSGIIPFIYTGAYFWAQYGDTSTFWGKYPLWLASYTSQSFMEENIKKLMKPWSTWTIWQYTDKGDGKAHGMESLGLDKNKYNGTKADFVKRFGLIGSDKDPLVTALEKMVETLTEVIQAIDEVRQRTATILKDSQDILDKLQ